MVLFPVGKKLTAASIKLAKLGDTLLPLCYEIFIARCRTHHLACWFSLLRRAEGGYREPLPNESGEAWKAAQNTARALPACSDEGCFRQGSHKPTYLVSQFRSKQHPQILNTHWGLLPVSSIIYKPGLHYTEQITTKSFIKTRPRGHNIYINMRLVATSMKTAVLSGRMEGESSRGKISKATCKNPRER